MTLRWDLPLIAAFAWGIAFASPVVHAAEQPRPRFYFDLDYFLPGNMRSSLDQPQFDINSIVASQNGTANASKEWSGAFGGRFGVLFPLKGFDGYWVGGNLGYVKGPTAKLTVNDPVVPPGTITFESENTYIRALLDIAHISELNRTLSFKFDVGVGLGKGITKQKERFLGYYSGLYDNLDASHSETKLTWEISPALMLKGQQFNFEFGLRYAQFPQIKDNDTTYKVDYSGFGIYTGMGF